MKNKSTINFNILKKTAQDMGVMYATKDDKFYITNGFIGVIMPYTKEADEIIIKQGATKSQSIATLLEGAKDRVSVPVYNTNICYGSPDSLSRYFKTEDGYVVKVKCDLLKMVEKFVCKSIMGKDGISPLVFDDGEIQVIVLPCRPGNKELKLLEFIRNNC